MSDVSLNLSEEAVFHKKFLTQKTIYAKTAQNMEIAFPKLFSEIFCQSENVCPIALFKMMFLNHCTVPKICVHMR
jgi:hypothetical protein